MSPGQFTGARHPGGGLDHERRPGFVPGEPPRKIGRRVGILGLRQDDERRPQGLGTGQVVLKTGGCLYEL